MSADPSRLTRLVAVAGDDADAERRNLLIEIASGYVPGCTRFSASQLSHFSVVLKDALSIADEELRRDIALRLAESPGAPKELITMLAEDSISVAEPVLRASPNLDDETLIRIVQRCSQNHKKAVAARTCLTAAVVAELVIHADVDVLLVLIENHDATIDAETMLRLVGRVRTLAALHGPMLRRPDLTATALTRIYFFVASSLKGEILRRGEKIDRETVLQAIDENRRRLAAPAPAERADDNESGAIRRRIACGAVSESLLNELLEQEMFAEFRLAFSHYVGVSAEAGAEILKDHSWQSLAVTCRAAGLERSTFARITSTLINGGAEHNNAVHMLDIYRRIPLEAAECMTRFWRVGAIPTASAGSAAAACPQPEAVVV